MNKSSQSLRQSRRDGSPGHRTELGRARITTAALIAALTSAALVAGCGSHSSSASSKPTVAATKTATAPPASAPAASAPASTASPAAPTTSGTEAAGDGTQLGAYGFELTDGYSAPLGVAAPAQSQMVSVNSGGPYDIMYDGNIEAGSGEKMISLPNGATPTYSACTTGTTFISGATPEEGAAFCIIETSGQMAGVTISGLSSSPATTATFKVTIWKFVS
jgi:hypothetical protein